VITGGYEELSYSVRRFVDAGRTSDASDPLLELAFIQVELDFLGGVT